MLLQLRGRLGYYMLWLCSRLSVPHGGQRGEVLPPCGIPSPLGLDGPRSCKLSGSVSLYLFPPHGIDAAVDVVVKAGSRRNHLAYAMTLSSPSPAACRRGAPAGPRATSTSRGVHPHMFGVRGAEIFSSTRLVHPRGRGVCHGGMWDTEVARGLRNGWNGLDERARSIPAPAGTHAGRPSR